MCECPTIEAQKNLVRKLHAEEGRGPNFERESDILHDMSMDEMAAKYREVHGLPPNAKTPYCGKRWSE